MDTKHTPGPWEAVGAMVRTAFVHGDPEQRGSLVAECAMGGLPSGDNARLIAAAPELLDAASAALDQIAAGPKGTQVYSRLKAAIAKATGSQS